MPQIIRVKMPGALDLIKEYLIPSDDFPSLDIQLQELKNQLSQNPTTTYYSIAVTDDKVEMFILAFIHPSNQYVVVHQIAVADDVPEKFQDQMFLRLVMWAEQNDIPDLRLGSTRCEVKVAERWGFVPYTLTMNLSVGKKIDELLTSKEQKVEDTNGTPRPLTAA